MDMQDIYTRFLDAFQTPAFIVEGDIITCCNHPMQPLPVKAGQPIKPLLGSGKDAYAKMPESSRLCLTVTINKIPYNASVVRTSNFDVFHLESCSPEPALQALTKASTNLRKPLSEAMLHAAQMTGSDAQALRKDLYQMHRAVCNMSDAGSFQFRRPPILELYNIKELISKLTEDAGSILGRSGIKLVFRCKGSDVVGAVDKEKLERAVLNMLCNAARNNRGTAPITVKLTCTKLRIKFAVQYNTGNVIKSYKQMLEDTEYIPDLSTFDSLPHLDMIIIRGSAYAHKGTLLLSYPDDNTACMTLSFPVSNKRKSLLRSNILLPMDYAGGYDHILTELSDILVKEVF